MLIVNIQVCLNRARLRYDVTEVKCIKGIFDIFLTYKTKNLPTFLSLIYMSTFLQGL